jgi:hypothetical protein
LHTHACIPLALAMQEILYHIYYIVWLWLKFIVIPLYIIPLYNYTTKNALIPILSAFSTSQTSCKDSKSKSKFRKDTDKVYIFGHNYH